MYYYLTLCLRQGRGPCIDWPNRVKDCVVRHNHVLFAAALALSGCTAVINQSSFFPHASPPPQATLAAPSGYALDEAIIPLPGLGSVHTVRLDNPASDATVIYAGGNMSFVAGQTRIAEALAKATNADVILYDYSGRGGTDVPNTIDAAIAFGPAFLQALRSKGWIGRGALFVHGLSFGGSQAAGIARNGGAAALIIEGSAADIAAVGRNFVPGLMKPFVRFRIDPELARFDYLGYAVAAKAPVLLIVSQDDTVVRPENMAAFADQLRRRGVSVTSVVVPGPHGSALRQPAAIEAIQRFVSARPR